MLRRAAAIAVVVALAAEARADRVVALAPLTTLDGEDTSAATKKLTAQIEAAVGKLARTKLVTAAQVGDAIRRAKKSQLKACDGDAACLTELGRLVGAQVVIAGQVGGLGDAKVVYLGATDVAAAKELRSTTLAVGAQEDASAASAAVVRLLDPDGYRGTLRFTIDAAGATIYVNGSKVAPAPGGEVRGAAEGQRGVSITLPVGTQAVRVTHPQYRDFVRFIDVPFGRTLDVAVAMTQYPIVQRDVRGRPIERDRVDVIAPPLWRRWYVVGPAAIGVAVVAAIVVGSLARGGGDAPCREVGGGQC